jgi:hypothetical protein
VRLPVGKSVVEGGLDALQFTVSRIFALLVSGCNPESVGFGEWLKLVAIAQMVGTITLVG